MGVIKGSVVFYCRSLLHDRLSAIPVLALSTAWMQIWPFFSLFSFVLLGQKPYDVPQVRQPAETFTLHVFRETAVEIGKLHAHPELWLITDSGCP